MSREVKKRRRNDKTHSSWRFVKRRCVCGLPFLGLQIGLHGFGNPRFWSSVFGGLFCSGEVRSVSYWAVPQSACLPRRYHKKTLPPMACPQTVCDRSPITNLSATLAFANTQNAGPLSQNSGHSLALRCAIDRPIAYIVGIGLNGVPPRYSTIRSWLYLLRRESAGRLPRSP